MEDLLKKLIALRNTVNSFYITNSKKHYEKLILAATGLFVLQC